MEKLALIIAAIVPCLIIFGIIVLVSRKRVPAVPCREAIICFSLGGLASIPLLLWALIFGHWEWSLIPYPFAYALYGAFIMAAVPEELCRYLILRWRLSRLPSPVDLMNCLLLGSTVGLGIGTFEHLYYAYDEGWQACWERLFTAVPIHTMAGAIVGFFVGLSVQLRHVGWGILGVSITIALHGIHNFLVAYLFEQSQGTSG
jgi:RsiW-degrading membrane proteinase PrsW (M82 family)